MSLDFTSDITSFTGRGRSGVQTSSIITTESPTFTFIVEVQRTNFSLMVIEGS